MRHALRFVPLTLMIAVQAPAPVLAQARADSPAEAEARAAIEGVIADQLGDFNARDVEGAWVHASPLIKGMFGTPETFGTMVEQGYPMVWTNRDAEFLDLRPGQGGLRQRVLVTDAEGRLWVLDYEMVPMPEGWQINGVQVLPAPEVGA